MCLPQNYDLAQEHENNTHMQIHGYKKKMRYSCLGAPLAMPVSSTITKSSACVRLVRWVPPQNSTEYAFQAGLLWVYLYAGGVSVSVSVGVGVCVVWKRCI
jgi:hypothetical protein